MEFKIYSLKLKNNNSNQYYKDVKLAKELFLNAIREECDTSLNEFMNFIEDNKIENLRSKEEYLIEIILIGVLIEEYIDNARAFKYKFKSGFRVLNNIRIIERHRSKVDKIRGILNFKILIKKKKINQSMCIKDIKHLIKWLDASGDFKEEALRINNWYTFLKYIRNKENLEKYLKLSQFCANSLYDIGEHILSKYIVNVDSYLSVYKEEHYNKEDIIYCGKGRIQYYFNMICSEIMNDIYSSRFLKTKEKIIFLPSCMKQNIIKCLSIRSNKGFKCRECSKNCNVNKLNSLVRQLKFSVYIVPHESSFLKLKNNNNNEIGIIGIACILNLISGGWKALRLEFIPQCAILDECGCSNHWLKNAQMTCVNEERIRSIINGGSS